MPADKKEEKKAQGQERRTNVRTIESLERNLDRMIYEDENPRKRSVHSPLNQNQSILQRHLNMHNGRPNPPRDPD